MEVLSWFGMINGCYFVFVFGFEYIFEGVFDLVFDVGIVLEYNYDECGEDSLLFYFLENDFVLGV